MYLIPTTLVHTLFSTPIPTSTFNFMQLFFILVYTAMSWNVECFIYGEGGCIDVGFCNTTPLQGNFHYGH